MFVLGFSVEIYQPELQTIFTASPTLITPTNSPQTITYTANVTNVGNDNANSVTLTTIIPNNTELIQPITGLPTGVTYTYNTTTRALKFSVPNGLLDSGISLNLNYNVSVYDNCYYLQNSCSSTLNSNLVATYIGQINPKDITTGSSNGINSCGIGNELSTTVNIAAPAPATWVTAASALDREIECNNPTALSNAQALAPVSSCPGLTPIKTSGNFVPSNNCPTLGTYTNTWNFTDSCGRTIANYVQIITVKDTTPPTFVEALPTNTTVDGDNIPDAPILTATDNCGDAIVTFNEEIVGDICTGNQTITREWIATDACNLTTSHTQVITVNQPVLTASIDSVTNILCSTEATGTITIAVSGGSLPYTYSIDGGTTYTSNATINDLAAGNYSIIILDAN